MQIRPVTAADRPWVTKTVRDHFASARIVSRGVVHDATQLPGFLAIHGAAPCGVVLYAICGADCEVVVLISLLRGRGVATALLAALEGIARDAGCRRLWLVTTNDNQPAIDFYVARGWSLKAVHEDAVVEARCLKPEIPRLGHDDVPIRDEFEFELPLQGSDARRDALATGDHE